MSEKLKTTYNGVVISYSEYDNSWRNEDTKRDYDTLTKAKEAIDRATKVSKKMDPMPCIICKPLGAMSNSAEFKKATITSFADEKSAWITLVIDRKGNKVRQKCDAECCGRSELYTDTPENWAIIENLNSLWKKEKEINNEIEEAYKNMQPINVALEYKRLNAKAEGDPE